MPHKNPLHTVREVQAGNPFFYEGDVNAVWDSVKSQARKTPTGVTGIVDAQGQHLIDPKTEKFVGVIKDQGWPTDPNDPIWQGTPLPDIPSSELDFINAMYWVWRARRTNPSSDTRVKPPIYEAIPVGEPGHLIVPAANLAECNKNTHQLAVDGSEVVTCHGQWLPHVVDGSVQKPQRHYWFDRSVGGGSCFVGVCVECTYNSTTGSLMARIHKLQSIPYGYDPDPEEAETVLAWAGVNPLIIPDMLVTCWPCATIPDDPDVKYIAMPMPSYERSQINPPAMECLTQFTEPCAGDFNPEICS